MSVSLLQSLAQAFTGSLLNTMAESFLLVSSVWLLLRLSRAANSRTRFVVWFLALLAIAALPFLATVSPTTRAADVRLPAIWAVYVGIAWAVGAGISLTRLALGWIKVARLRRRCQPVDAARLSPLLLQKVENSRGTRKVEICESDDNQVPAAVGF